MTSKKITKYLRKLSKTETEEQYNLNKIQLYWANKLVTQLKQEQNEIHHNNNRNFSDLVRS